MAKSQRRYEIAKERIRQLIADGTLQPGQKVPSVRTLSKQLGFSISTIVLAYDQLAIEGTLDSRPRSGFYVAQPQEHILPEVSESNQPALSKKQKVTFSNVVILMNEIGEKPHIIPMGTAIPHPSMLPLKKLKRMTQAAVREMDSRDLIYGMDTASQDEPQQPQNYLAFELAKQSLSWGVPLHPNEVVVTCGAMEAVNYAIRAAVRPGDTVAIESPSYYPILQNLENMGIYAYELNTRPQHGPDMEALEKALKQKAFQAAYFMPNGNNPLGYVWSDERKAKIVRLFQEYDTPIIEDDVYGDICWTPKRPLPLKAFDEKGLVLTANSVSKCISPGLRVGWLIAGRYLESVKRLKYMTNMGTSALSQRVTAQVFRSGLFRQQTEKLRYTLRDLAYTYSEAIARYFPSPTKLSRPMGGYSLWVQLPRAVDGFELYTRSIAHGFSITPGEMFSATGDSHQFMRICYGTPWSDAVEEAIATLGKLVRNCPGPS